MIGRTLSHYVLEAPLGKGGMGEVYGARDSRLGRSVAIKILPAASTSRDSIQRFMTEAKAASALNHPNIVTVHDVDQADGVHFIVMEKIDGVALSSLAGEPIPVERFVDIALQATSALAAAHAAGIVHRDIKPANIMLTPSGSVKVVDFGLARLIAPDQSVSGDEATAQWVEQATRPGTVLGTLGYMSPEQLEGRRADARADVFSLGVVFHTLLTGKATFSASSPLMTVAAILRDQPPRVDSARTDVPKQLADVIARCLEKEPAARYANAAEVHDALRALPLSVRTPERRFRWILASAVVIALIAIAAAAYWWRRESRVRWARQVAPGEVERLLEADDPVGAFTVARQAMAVAPDDTQVKQTWVNLVFPITITSEPPGAEVSIRSYLKKDGAWVSLGRTPLEKVAVPYPQLRYRVALDGYATREVSLDFESPDVMVKMFRASEVPAGMVAVSGGSATFVGQQATVPDFFIDQYEVTNAEFKRFVDAGGYRRQELWKHPFEENGKTLAWKEAMLRFVDGTGRPGPGGWEFGSFPEGKAKHPVDEISWYEAAAFAEFSGKTLPTVFHWSRAATMSNPYADILRLSNFASASAVPVGTMQGVGAAGTYDMAGNVEEWCVNAVGAERYVLGASWKDPAYQYSEADAAPPMARREAVGVRLIRQNGPIAPNLAAAVERKRILPTTPVDDATFALYKSLYDYDPVPLAARVEEVDDSHEAWRLERVSFTTAYGERMIANLFLPKNAKPPFQAILYFPPSDATIMPSSRRLWLRMVEFYVRSGRALMFPVYQGTYERRRPPARGPNERRDLRIQRVKDARRSVDYLVSRPDIQGDRISYYGLSLGASLAPLILATEPRLRSAVLLAGGLSASPALPEARAENFLPRVKVPTMLLAGRYDFTFPMESSQRTFFDMLGAPPDQKKYVLFEGGHIPNQFNEAVKEMLAWTDRWMGPVEERP